MRFRRENSLPLLAAVFIILLLLLLVVYINRPQPLSPAGDRTETAGPAGSSTPAGSPTARPAPTVNAAATLQAGAGQQLLNEKTAADFIAMLPEFAAPFAVEIIDVQAQPRHPENGNEWISARTFLLTASGERTALLDFIGLLRASVPYGVRFENLQISAADGTNPVQLMVFLTIRTTAAGAGAVVTPTSAATWTVIPPTASPTAAASSTATVIPTPTRQLHIVQSGETLFRIAALYDIPVAELRTANGLTDNNIIPGQTLIIP